MSFFCGIIVWSKKNGLVDIYIERGLDLLLDFDLYKQQVSKVKKSKLFSVASSMLIVLGENKRSVAMNIDRDELVDLFV